MSQLRQLIASAVLLGLPSLVLAQAAETPNVPAAPAPQADPGYGYGYPPPYPFPPRMMPPEPAPWERAMPGQLRISREAMDDAYVVRIAVGDGKTVEVQVTPIGRSLAISRAAQAESVQEDTFGDGRGYQRSFSFSHGSTTRRIRIPPDADLSQMTREETGGTIVLRIPRIPLGRALPAQPRVPETQTAPQLPPTTH